MKKTLTYTTFIGATAVVIFLFVTATSYTQLAVASVLYPGIAFLALNIFPRRIKKEYEIKIQIPTEHNEQIQKAEPVQELVKQIKEEETAEVADHDKRDFLKLIGIAGVSVFLLSIFNKRSPVPFLGKGAETDNLKLTDSEGKVIDPAQAEPFDGYHICEIDDDVISYYGFINKEGEWYIMREDTSTSSYRYAKGDTNFPGGWSNRERLKYDYFYNI